jgi:hypothetical protein
MKIGRSGMGWLSALLGQPAFLRGFHGWMTLAWGVLIPGQNPDRLANAGSRFLNRDG